jgi:hypothetical protein
VTDLPAVASDLYALPAGEFTAARNARAREMTDKVLAKQVKALKRPSVAAWAVNRLVRDRPEEISQLLDLGAELRQAQDELAGDDLHRLNEQRHAVLAAVTKQARAVAADHGQALSESVARQVESTLRAALADEGAAAAVRSGLLTSHLQASGFSPANLQGAVALPDITRTATASVSPERGSGRSGRRLEQARREAERAERAASAAARDLQDAEDEVAAIASRREELADRIAELTQELQQARAEDKEAARHARDADRVRDEAARAKRAADREAAKARSRLDRLS